MASEFIQQELNKCPDCRGVGRIINVGKGREGSNEECPRCDKLKSTLQAAFRAARAEVAVALRNSLNADLAEEAVGVIEEMDRP